MFLCVSVIRGNRARVGYLPYVHVQHAAHTEPAHGVQGSLDGVKQKIGASAEFRLLAGLLDQKFSVLGLAMRPYNQHQHCRAGWCFIACFASLVLKMHPIQVSKVS